MFAPIFATEGSAGGGDLSLFQRDLSGLAQVREARGTAVDPPRNAVQASDIHGHEVLAASSGVAGPGWLVLVELPVVEADTAVP